MDSLWINGPYASEVESAGGYLFDRFLLWVYNARSTSRPVVQKDPPHFVVPVHDWTNASFDQLEHFHNRLAFMDSNAPKLACLPRTLPLNWGTRIKNAVFPTLTATARNPLAPTAGTNYSISNSTAILLACIGVRCHVNSIWRALIDNCTETEVLPHPNFNEIVSCCITVG